MDAAGVAITAGLVFAWALVGRRLERLVLTGPIVFLVLGVLVGPEALDVVPLSLDDGVLRHLLEITLALVLFSDAARIDLARLRRRAALPARMLGIGLPLTVAAGTGCALLLLDVDLGLALLIAAVLAPTDAALGQPVVTDESLPSRVRQTLNVESGLNDGIAAPVVTLGIAVVGVEGAGPAGDWIRFAFEQIGVGLLVGLVAGVGGGWLLDRAARRGWAGTSQQQIAAFALALGAFAAAVALDGNGFIAAFVAGLGVGVTTRGTCEHVVEFVSEEGELLVLLAWLVFGGAFVGPLLGDVDARTWVYAVLSLTVLRMVPIALSLLGAGLRAPTVALLAWFGPRGLASIVFALLALEELGEEADPVITTMTATVVLSVLAHGLSARWLSERYGAWWTRETRAMDEHEVAAAAEMAATPELRARGGPPI